MPVTEILQLKQIELDLPDRLLIKQLTHPRGSVVPGRHRTLSHAALICYRLFITTPTT